MTTTSLQPVRIQDRNSGLFFQYIPNAANEAVELERKASTDTQEWFVTDSGVAGYVYIQSKHDNNVITAGDDSRDPLTVDPKKDSLDLNQVWILRDPNDDGSSNHYFIIQSAKTGYVMNVRGANKNPDAVVQIYKRTNSNNEQFAFIPYGSD